MPSAAMGHIPLSRPQTGDAEIDAVAEVLRSGNLAQGERVAEFEHAFAGYVGAQYAVATSSGTTALQVALLASGVGPGDEVITTPFTFVATATSILHVGARPVFADVDPATLTLSPESVEQHITTRTRAIMPVHLYGNPCDLDGLTAIARLHDLLLIEDACQAHGARYAGRRVGATGTACFSFYPTKNMTCAEGGMICTSDVQIAERARLLRNHGMRVRYVHDMLGYNLRLTDVHAAIGLAQLRQLDSRNQRRRQIAAFYDERIDAKLRVPLCRHAESAWHQYTLRIEPRRRDPVLDHIQAAGVGVGVYYPIPLHRQPFMDGAPSSEVCPAADEASTSVLSIPVHPVLTDAECEYIVDVVKDALENA